LDGNEDDYEYYEDSPALEVTSTGEFVGAAELNTSPRGYQRPVGSAEVEINVPLANDAFVDYVVSQNYCVPAAKSRVKSSEEEERLRLEEEEKKRYIVDPKMEEKRNEYASEISSMMKSTQEAKTRRLSAALKNSKIFGTFNAALERELAGATVTNETNVTLVNGTLANNSLLMLLLNNSLTPNKPVKRLRHQFRLNEVEKLKKKAEVARIKDTKVQKFVLGPDCETMICGVCKVIVEEFALQLTRSLDDPKIKYVEEVFNGFCGSPNLSSKYIDLVAWTCREKLSDVSYSLMKSLDNLKSACSLI
jgi:hypothetical protein